VTLTSPLPARYADALSVAFKLGWERDFWPRLMELVEPTVTEDDSGFFTISLGSGPTAMDVNLEECLFESDPRIEPIEPVAGVRTLSDGAGGSLLVLPTELSAPWLFYRPTAPKFSMTAYSGVETVTIGDVRYYATNGECYRALKAGAAALSDATAWKRQVVPEFLADYAIDAAAGQLLSDDQARYRTRAAAEVEMERVLEKEYGGRGIRRRVRM